ncbi:HAD hydrolase family protein [Sorangium sp. KYC3313]|uniref:HAD family hydrolase n=1 Tax=Sorangium sp. KYC3313 TaxID=3449740 RepID=UPI003F8BD7DB
MSAADALVLFGATGDLAFKKIFQHPLDNGAAAVVIATLERHGADVWVYQGDDWLVRRADAPRVALEQAAVQVLPRVVERREGVVGHVLMFRESGLRLAMGHARAVVQRQARFITLSNDDEGFAHAVETWLLTASGGQGGRGRTSP